MSDMPTNCVCMFKCLVVSGLHVSVSRELSMPGIRTPDSVFVLVLVFVFVFVYGEDDEATADSQPSRVP